MLTAALETDSRSVHLHQYHRELLDKEPGETIFTDFLADILMNKNQKQIVNFNTFGKLGDFCMTGSAKVVNEGIFSSRDAELINLLSDKDIQEQEARINRRIRTGQIAQLDPPSEAGVSVAADYHAPDPNTSRGTLHAIATKLVRDQRVAERHQPVSDAGGSDAHGKFGCSSIASGSGKRIGQGYFEHLAAVHAGKPTVVDQKLESLFRQCPDSQATGRLMEFATGDIATKSYRLAAKPDGSSLRIDEGLGEQVVEVKNLVLPILQG